MQVSKKQTVTTVSTFQTAISAEMIRAAFGLPKDARVYFVVPGGGDWSNTDIDIDRNHPICVEWTHTETVDK